MKRAVPPQKIGSFALVLHSHLPYVIAHGKWPHGMDWLNEAASGCYLPILNILYELIEDGFSPHVTIGISPILCEQLADNAFKKEFSSYLDTRTRAAREDVKEYLAGNLCRCTGYVKIIDAVLAAAEMMRKGGK